MADRDRWNPHNRAQVNRYDEFGRPAAQNSGRFGYTGQAYLPEIGLYYYKARMYSPMLGRFMQTDPIGYADGLNMYGYVGNDPINSTDPSGLRECPAGTPAGTLCGQSQLPSNPSNGGGGGGGFFINPIPIIKGIGCLIFGCGNKKSTGARSSQPPAEQKLPQVVCQGPPIAPGTRATPGDLIREVQKNVNAAQARSVIRYGAVRTLNWFHANVRTGGRLDYKTRAGGFENFGNYNYGAMGAAAGIPEQVLLRAAGRNQEQNTSYDAAYGHWYGGAPYGDDPRDQAMIRRGIADYKADCY